MDCRITLGADETFLDLLVTSLKKQEKVFLLIDEEGISRKEGFLREVHAKGPNPFIEMEDGTTVALQAIIAVNGIFLPGYSEC